MENKYSELFTCFKNVFETVFDEQVKESKEIVENVCLDNEVIVASLKLTGDFPGVLIMVLPVDRVDDIAMHMLERFSVKAPLKNKIIFDEILNMCAGNLATQLKLIGKDIKISVPDKEKDYCKYSDKVYAYKISTKDQSMFKFCLPLILNEKGS